MDHFSVECRDICSDLFRTLKLKTKKERLSSINVYLTDFTNVHRLFSVSENPSLPVGKCVTCEQRIATDFKRG